MSDDAEATQDASSQAEREVAQGAPAEAAAAPDVAEAAPAQVERPAGARGRRGNPTGARRLFPRQGREPPRPPSRRSARYGRTRSIAVGLFFFLTCLSLILATTTWWLHDTVLDTDRFVALTADLASNPEVQAALVESTVTQVDEALGLGPVGSYVVAGIAREVYASDAFAKIWEGLMSVVHSQVVQVLRGDSNLAQVEDGQIVVNLFPVIDVVLEKVNSLDLVIAGNPIVVPDITNPDDPTASREELSAALGRELKPTFGVIPIAPSAKLEAAQRYVTIFDALTIVLWVITGLLALLTLALARRRLRMVALLGIGGLVALLVARLVIASAADGIATAVAEGGPGAIIGGQVAQQIAASYREFARSVLLVGLVAAVGATLAAWVLERRAGSGAAGDGTTSLADGWFLALAGLTIALALLLVVGFTVVTLALVGVAYVAWLVPSSCGGGEPHGPFRRRSGPAPGQSSTRRSRPSGAARSVQRPISRPASGASSPRA